MSKSKILFTILDTVILKKNFILVSPTKRSMNSLKRLLLSLFTILSLASANAQTKRIDSLVNLISTLPDDTTLLKTRNELMRTYVATGDFDKVLEYTKANEELANKLIAAHDTGLIYKTIRIQLGGTMMSRGAAWMRKGNNAKALECFIRSSNLLESYSNKKEYMKALNNIGVVFVNIGESEKALDYFEKSLKISEEIGYKEGVIKTYLNMGNIYSDLKQNKKAIVYLNKCLQLAEEEKYTGVVAGALGNLGMTYGNLGDHDKALTYYFRCLKISQDIGDKLSIARCYNKIGETYHTLKKSDQSLKYALMCYELAVEIGVLDLKKRSALELTKIYEEANKPAEAFKYYKIFVSSRDSLLNLEQTKTVMQKELQFEFEKKESVNKVLQEKKDALAEKEKHEQKLVRNYLIVGFVMVTFMVIVVYKNFRQKAKANQIISRQKEEVESQKAKVESQNELLEEKNKEITDSINYAKRIQYTLLANKDLLKENIKDHFILFEPKDIVSGDFYWASKHGDNFYLAVCDSTGHGVPGAFMSLLNMSFLNESVSEKNIAEPNKIFDHVRKRLIENISHGGAQDGMDAVMLCLNRSSNTLTYAAANNSSILIRNKNVIPLDYDNMPVGKGEKNDSFTLRKVDLQKDDLLFLFTDGYADQFGGPKGKKLKYKPLVEIILNNCELPLSEQYEKLRNTFELWKGGLEQVDDVCVIGIRI